MTEYLIGIMFHEPEAWKLWSKGIIEDYESSTGLYVEADSLQEAMSWAETVGEKLLKYVNEDDSLNYKELGYYCWHEPNIEESGWSHCLGHFQHVKAGEMPVLENMSTKAYEKWQNENT